jgi:glycosyltransferase involved in cell wall biosynthesis
MSGPAARLRVAVIGLGRYSGGSPISLHLTRALADRHVVRAFVGREARNLGDWQASGIDIDLHETYSTAVGALMTMIGRRRIKRLARAIEAFQPDVAVAPFIHLWVWPLMSLLRVPVVVVLHDPEPHPGLTGVFWHAIDRRIARAAQHVILHSTSFVPVVQERYGVDASRITVVPIGPLGDYTRNVTPTDTAATPPAATASSPATTATPAPSAGPRVLLFGRMDRYKGIEVMLDAVPAIVAACPGATIRLVGSGLDRSLAARAVATQGVTLEDRWVDESEVPTYFGQADLVVLPYTSATQSGVIPVAAAFALPVIASDVGGLAEQLDGGACGVLVPPSDAAALARAVVAIWTDPTRARALGQSLHDAYATRRSWPSIAESVTKAFQLAIRRAQGNSTTVEPVSR